MPKIRIRYLSDKIEKLRYIDGKSDWIDLRAAETISASACTVAVSAYVGALPPSA